MFGFDAELNETAWFDFELLPEGIFDRDLIVASEVAAATVVIKQLAALGAG